MVREEEEDDDDDDEAEDEEDEEGETKPAFEMAGSCCEAWRTWQLDKLVFFGFTGLGCWLLLVQNPAARAGFPLL